MVLKHSARVLLEHVEIGGTYTSGTFVNGNETKETLYAKLS